MEGAEFTALGVTIPRLDDVKNIGYNASLAKYMASGGQLMAAREDESTRTITEEGAQSLRYAAMLARQVAHGKMDAIGLEEVVFSS
eukprot:5816934-Karenia_brevis.AAC.1